tara:strand:- start:23834 stop:23983 length:150 start_codon:yes stop_codon:yes gene_type:complete
MYIASFRIEIQVQFISESPGIKIEISQFVVKDGFVANLGFFSQPGSSTD